MRDFSEDLRPVEPQGSSLLAAERSRSSLPVDKTARHLFGDEFLERQDRVLRIMEDENLLSKAAQLHLARADRYKLLLARSKLLRRLAERHGWSVEDQQMADYLLDEESPYSFNYHMFVTTVREQASDEQQAHWLPLIQGWKIVGCYAQTELGHGSNVRGLELTATYDTSARQYVLHSPTLTASKWWNGAMGRTATHAIVVAQLLLPKTVGGKEYVSHGPHPFIVEIRDPHTHKPHNGIIVGDIGPKYGFAGMDNGYMLFDHYRIPHSAFLCRHAKVAPDTGAYSPPAERAVVYGSLTDMRVNIVMKARLVLARAVTVAVRYLTIRKQFHDPDARAVSAQETTVMDFPTVQLRVVPLLATTFALHYTGTYMATLVESSKSEIKKGNYTRLADLHAASAGLKSLCTTYAADGIETCRLALGGHGYGGGSGLVGIGADYPSQRTVEGDNWMITRQTASYLIKKVQHIISKIGASRLGPYEPVDDTERAITDHLRAQRIRNLPRTLKILTQDHQIVKAFEVREATLAVRAYNLRIGAKKGLDSMSIQLHELSNAHSQTVLVRNFYEALNPADGSESKMPLKAWPVMRTCFRLFSLHTISAHVLEFLSTGCFTPKTADRLAGRITGLMKELRPHVVRLADAWSIPDYLLNSALGRSDGKVYEALFEQAHYLNPLNAETINSWYWEEEIVMGQGPYKLPYEEVVERHKASKL